MLSSLLFLACMFSDATPHEIAITGTTRVSAIQKLFASLLRILPGIEEYRRRKTALAQTTKTKAVYQVLLLTPAERIAFGEVHGLGLVCCRNSIVAQTEGVFGGSFFQLLHQDTLNLLQRGVVLVPDQDPVTGYMKPVGPSSRTDKSAPRVPLVLRKAVHFGQLGAVAVDRAIYEAECIRRKVRVGLATLRLPSAWIRSHVSR